VNRDGSIVVEPRFDFVDDFHEGRALVRSGGLYGYVDLQGQRVVEPQYPIAGRYYRGLAEVDVGGKSALIDLDGRQVLAPRFIGAVPFTRNVFWVNDGERSHINLRPGREEFPGANAPPPGNPLRHNAKWGLVDATGTWIRAPEFRDIASFDPENENLMWAQARTGWGLIRPDGTWAVEPTFQYKLELSDNRAAVWRGGKTGYIDRAGQIVIPLQFDIEIGDHGFAQGMPAPAKLGRLVGLIDRSGQWVLEPAYDHIFSHYGGEAPLRSDLEFKGFVAKRGDRTDLLDTSGKVLIGGLKLWPGTSRSYATPGGGISIQFTLGQFTQFCPDGRIIGFMDYKPRLFERNGTGLDPSEGEMWWPITCEPPYVVKIGGRFAHVDGWLRPLTAERFNAVGLFQHGLAAVELRGRYGLIRSDGTWAIEPRLDRAQPFRPDVALVKEDGRAGLVNTTTSKWITQTPFDDVCPSEYGIVGVMLNGKAGAIDETGAWVIEPKYDTAHTFGLRSGLVPVRANDKWGFVDVTGKGVIEARFDEVSYFERGVSWTRSDAEWCAVDRRGTRIPALSCQSATPTNIHTAQSFSCQIAPLRMPEAPQ
jgi:WG containing repeat